MYQHVLNAIADESMRSIRAQLDQAAMLRRCGIRCESLIARLETLLAHWERMCK